MSLGPGTRLGPYEVIAAIGAGGMGEVYRARDTRLDRTVAIKILPAAVAGDPIFRERFDREARSVAALNHPHICALYDIGDEAGTAFLVMEYLEGETLADRLAKGALPIDQALKYAIQIAEALDKAHRAGIVHRDLKPGNIMLVGGRGGPSGPPTAKLLDFGLAKTSSAAGLSGLSILPTAHSPVTAQGTILGTLQYMAPEQVEGREADARSDIFAFGAIVYEMVTGKRAFEGKSQASVIAAILDREPPAMSSLQPLAPALLEHIVERCLAKDPDARWQSARDLMGELRWTAEVPRTGAMPIASRAYPRATRNRIIVISLLALLSAVAFGFGLSYLRARVPTAIGEIRLSIVPPPNVAFSRSSYQNVAVISPDGQRVAFIGVRPGGGPQLVVRSIDSLDALPLPGTEAATLPFWSPDSSTIAFFAGSKLKTIKASGGPVQTLCDAAAGQGGTWGTDGTIIFATGTAGRALSRIPASGGAPMSLSSPRPQPATVFRYPAFLPDGRHFLYVTYPSNTVSVASLDSNDTTRLVGTDSQVQYAPPGYLLLVRQGTLLAQPFDADRASVAGDAATIAQQLSVDPLGYATFSASNKGLIAYRSGPANTETQLTWFDRKGRVLGRVGPSGVYRNITLSPDGSRLAVEETDQQNRTQDIWIIDVTRGTKSRFTFDAANDIYPVWSPDGSRIVFASDRGGMFNLYQKLSNGAGNEQIVAKDIDSMVAPYSWSPDGRYIVYRLGTMATGILPLIGELKGRPLLQSESSNTWQVYSQVSPDSRWIAYTSNESGRNEVYVRNFPTPGPTWQVSQDGALFARWRRDMKELFYYGADGRLFAVPIRADAAMEVGQAVPLFEARMLNGPYNGVGLRYQYDVTSDGQRFLLNVPLEDAPDAPITVVINWTAAARGSR